MAQVFDSFLEEFTLDDLAIEFVLAQGFKDKAEVSGVFFLIRAVDEDVINVDNDKFIKEGSKYILNKGLEGGRGIG